MPSSTTENPLGSSSSRASLLTLCAGAAALLLTTGAARADSLGFVGGLPDAPHVLIDLTPDQLREIARATQAGKHWPLPEIQLTRAQRDALREGAGAEVRWLFVAKKEWLAGDCTCGTYNLGVVAGQRLAVLQMDLGDHLGSRDLAAMERALVEPKLQVAAGGPSPSMVGHEWREGVEAPEPLRALVARFPGDFALRLALGNGWKAQRVRLPAIPRHNYEQLDMAASLYALSAVSARPDAAMTIEWPKRGARLDADGKVFLLLPGLVEGEIGPKARAWFLLEYEGGWLKAAAARTEWGWAGAMYEWPEAGEPH